MSWAEIKKAINSDFSTPLNTLITNFLNDSTYGLNAIKTQVVKNQNWYAIVGTSSTLYSLSSEVSSSNRDFTIATITIPSEGHYRLDFSGTIKNNSNNSLNTELDVYLNDYNNKTLKAYETMYTANAPGATATYSLSNNVTPYFRKGDRIIIVGHSSHSSTTATMKTLTLKYVKKLVQ